MATESFLIEQQAGVGLQSLSRSRMATSPLVNLVDPTGLGSTSGILSKSVSFQNVPADFSTRYIDEVKIQKHMARAQSASTMSVYPTQQSKRNAAFNAASNFAKGKYMHIFELTLYLSTNLVAIYWMTIFTGIFGIALSGSILFTASTSTCTD